MVGGVLALFDVAVDKDRVFRHKAVKHRFRIGFLQPDDRDGRGIDENDGERHQDNQYERTNRNIAASFFILYNHTRHPFQ